MSALSCCTVEEVVGKEEWNLRGRNLSSDEHAERVALLLGRAATVAAPRARVVDLQESQLSPAGGAAIGKALKVNAGLTKLRLSRNNERRAYLGMSSDGYELDLPQLRGTDPVESLDLSSKDLEDLRPASASMIASLIAGNAVLTKLNLDGFALDLPKLRGTDPVTSLDLSNKGLGPASATVIASLIAGNAVLKSINLLRNNITVEGAAPLVKLFRERPHMESLCGLKPDQTEANFAHWGLRNTDALLIAADLEFNGVLKTLDIGYNSLGNEDATALASALRVNGVLTELDLSSNNINVAGAEALASALRVNDVLKTLNLKFNGIQEEGALAIVEVLYQKDLCVKFDGKVVRDAESGWEWFDLKFGMFERHEREVWLDHYAELIR